MIPSEPDERKGLSARRNFSVRLPEELHRELEETAARTGTSMNKLIASAVAEFVERPDLSPSAAGRDISSVIAQEAIRMGTESIGPIKGIAKHAANRGQVALACVLWAAAARLVATGPDGARRAADELAHSASVAEGANHWELAVAMYREALEIDPDNLEVRSRLGQRVHHLAQRAGDDVDRYRDAATLLADAVAVDNYAKLFHGWSAWHVAQADSDSGATKAALNEIVDALKAWCFGQRGAAERPAWVRQLRRLTAIGAGEEVDELMAFARRNAHWEEVGPSDLEA